MNVFILVTVEPRPRLLPRSQQSTAGEDTDAHGIAFGLLIYEHACAVGASVVDECARERLEEQSLHCAAHGARAVSGVVPGISEPADGSRRDTQRHLSLGKPRAHALHLHVRDLQDALAVEA